MRLFVLLGKARVGKTTLAEQAAKVAYENGFKPILLPFAKPLKDMAKEKGYDKDTMPEEYRKFCQEYGSQKREEDEDYWVNLWYDEVKRIFEADSDSERVVIVDDCRYPNELQLIHELNGTTLFIHSGERELPDANAEWRNHESEVLANSLDNSDDTDLLDVCTFHIANDGSLAQYLWFNESLLNAVINNDWDFDSETFRADFADRLLENIGGLPE